MRMFKLTKDALVLGEEDEKYGFTLWAATDQGNVMFNSKVGHHVAGTQLTAEEATPKVTKEGNKPYLRLSKVKVIDSGSQGGGQSVPSATNEPKPQAAADPDIKVILELVRDNNDMLTKLLGNDESLRDL